MKNVIALGLMACAALFNVQTVHAAEETSAEYLARMTCSDGPGEIRQARWMGFEKNQMTRKQAEAKGLTRDEYYAISSPLLEMADARFTKACLDQYAKAGLDFSKDWTEADIDKSVAIQESLGKSGVAYYKGVAQIINEELTNAAKAKAEPAKVEAPSKVYSIMDVLNNQALKSQLVQCEAQPDAARIISQIRSDAKQTQMQYKQEVQFLRDNGYDGITANRQAAKTILDPANQDAKFNSERADKFVNKCLSQNYGWTYKNYTLKARQRT